MGPPPPEENLSRSVTMEETEKVIKKLPCQVFYRFEKTHMQEHMGDLTLEKLLHCLIREEKNDHLNRCRNIMLLDLKICS